MSEPTYTQAEYDALQLQLLAAERQLAEKEQAEATYPTIRVNQLLLREHKDAMRGEVAYRWINRDQILRDSWHAVEMARIERDAAQQERRRLARWILEQTGTDDLDVAAKRLKYWRALSGAPFALPGTHDL